MIIQDIATYLASVAPPYLQESYDNTGLLTGDASWECKGIICSLDVTEQVIQEAVEKKCNLVVAHHPIIFTGLKKITGSNYVEKTVIAAIKNDIAIYAIHTNLDNIISGVNGKMADKLGLHNRKIIQPAGNTLKKLFTFVPVSFAEKLRSAIFAAGGGEIGNYSECSFNTPGEGTFKAGPGSDPYIGSIGKRHIEKEIKIEVIFPFWLEQEILVALKKNHPYEEIAYEIITTDNIHQHIGSGLIGDLPHPVTEKAFLHEIKEKFKVVVIRHTSLTGRKVKKVALCGGAGSFLIKPAITAGADIYITSDVKYHEFFEASDRLIIADIGHYESEQFTIDLLCEFLQQKFLTFAVLKTEVKTNPVQYYIS